MFKLVSVATLALSAIATVNGVATPQVAARHAVMARDKTNYDQARLEVLAQKAPPLRRGPFYARFGDGDLDVGSVGDGLEQIEQLADFGDVSALVSQRIIVFFCAAISSLTQQGAIKTHQAWPSSPSQLMT